MMRPKRILPAMLAVAASAAFAAGCGSGTPTRSGTSPTTRTTTATAARHGGPILTTLRGTTGQKGSLGMLSKLSPVRRRVIQSHLTGFAGVTLSDKLASYATDIAYLWNLEFADFGPTRLPPATLAIIDQTPAMCGSRLGESPSTEP